MCKKNAIVLLALTAAILLPLAAQAQGQDRGRRALGRYGMGPAAPLIEDIQILQRLVVVQLNDQQLEAILTLYAQQPQPAADPDSPLGELQQIKLRLLQGNIPVALDRGLLRDALQKLQQPAAQPASETALPPLGEAIWDLLDMTQRAALLGDVRQAAANNQTADRTAALRAIKLLSKHRELDPAQWTATRDRLAAALSEAAGPSANSQRQNVRMMFVEFLDRIKAMPDTEFARKQNELATELLALLPPGSNVTVSLAVFEGRLIQAAMAATFLHPRASTLLEEMKAERAKLPPAG